MKRVFGLRVLGPLRDLPERELLRALQRGTAVVEDDAIVPVVSGGAVPGPGHVISTNGSAISLSAGVAKTVILLIAGTNNVPHITEIGIGFDGVTAAAAPVLVELVTSTAATAGTSTPGTINQTRGRVRASGCTAGINYTAEPTVLTALKPMLLDPYKGLVVIQYPLGREPETDLSTGTTRAIGLRMNAPAAVGVRGWIEFE